jgi:hypothetical protein
MFLHAIADGRLPVAHLLRELRIATLLVADRDSDPGQLVLVARDRSCHQIGNELIALARGYCRFESGGNVFGKPD